MVKYKNKFITSFALIVSKDSDKYDYLVTFPFVQYICKQYVCHIFCRPESEDFVTSVKLSSKVFTLNWKIVQCVYNQNDCTWFWPTVTFGAVHSSNGIQDSHSWFSWLSSCALHWRSALWKEVVFHRFHYQLLWFKVVLEERIILHMIGQKLQTQRTIKQQSRIPNLSETRKWNVKLGKEKKQNTSKKQTTSKEFHGFQSTASSKAPC